MQRVKRTLHCEEVWPSASSTFRCQNRQQDLLVRPRRSHRSEARLFQCTGHTPSRSRGTWHLPFSVCMAQQFSPLSSWPPSLSAALLSAPLSELTPTRGTMRPLTPAPVHPVGRSPRLPRQIFPSFRLQPRSAPRYRLTHHLSVSDCFRASPWNRWLAATQRRIEFVLLRTDSSPPVAPHPASQRRSYLRLRSCGTLRHGLPPCWFGAIAGARFPPSRERRNLS